MPSRTIFLSRLIGLYCLLLVPVEVIYRQATLDSLSEFLHNPLLILVFGAILLVAGLAMVLAHNIWSGGALAVIVTVMGWLTLIKSLYFLYLPEVGAQYYLKALRDPLFYYLCIVMMLVIGIYLTYGGFRSKSLS